MAIRVVGAGVGRTGTLSLKTALEQLLGQPCYHMLEVFGHPEHVSFWHEAAEGGKVDWAGTLSGYGATSDFPACLFWQEILDANPDAVVVLSTRKDSRSWWASASQTIFAISGSHLPPEMADWFEMWKAVTTSRFTPDWTDETAARAAYDRHNAEVRASVPADKLVDWQPGDGWQPLCEPLGVPLPDEPFPHLNTREEFPKVDEHTDVGAALETFGQGK
jgi:Sulfotransferase domain